MCPISHIYNSTCATADILAKEESSPNSNNPAKTLSAGKARESFSPSPFLLDSLQRFFAATLDAARISFGRFPFELPREGNFALCAFVVNRC